MEFLYLIFILQIVSGISFIILLQKMNKLELQIEETTKKVEDYVSYVMLEEAKEEDFYVNTYDEEQESHAKEQHRLIQAVLGEIFP